MKDPTSQLRTATRRAKSDVANKLVSMFLHEFSRRVSKGWATAADSQEYEALVRRSFGNRCPYCSCDLEGVPLVIEHLDGMNRHRVGLHVAGNVLVACKRCNNEKRRDDSLPILTLAKTGWESFLSHDGSQCPPTCPTCTYWRGIWRDDEERRMRMNENLQRLRAFRGSFLEFEKASVALKDSMPRLLAKLYSDCQSFAEKEIESLLNQFEGEILAVRAKPR